MSLERPKQLRSGAYHPEDLVRFLREHRARPVWEIAEALGVPMDRIHYAYSAEGWAALERRSLEYTAMIVAKRKAMEMVLSGRRA